VLKPIKGHPGRYLDTSSGQVLNIAEYREDDKYDTIFIPSAIALDFGKQFIFFRDIMQKRPIDTNFTQPSRLSAGEEMVVDRVGLYVRHVISGFEPITSLDIVRLAENGFFRVEVNSILLTEGPMYKYPSGYGMSGGFDEENSVTVGIGVPSTAAAAKLVKTQTLTSRHEVIGYLIFHNHDWILSEANIGLSSVTPIQLSDDGDYHTAGAMVTAFLHGLIKSAVSK